MDSYYRPTWAEISLDALQHNIETFRRAISPSTKLLACVKANAYGHGAIGVSREAERLGIDYLSVAFLDEAIQLRQAGIKTPILVLGYTAPEAVTVAQQFNVTLTVFSQEVAEAIAQLPVDEKKLKVHVKIDSGMGRLGLLPGEDALAFIASVQQMPQVELEGMFTHFSCADECDKSYTMVQYRRFQYMVDGLQALGIVIPIIHTGNSATGIDLPELTGNMLRLGISLYGLYPSDEVEQDRVDLKPVLSLKTKLVRVQSLPEQYGISYGKKYVTKRNGEIIGTMPIGYADGFSRMMGGKVEVLVRGKRVPVLGNICMDQCMVQLSEMEEMNIEAGEEVVLVGSQGEETITVEELAAHTGTINYEFVCMLASRVARVYTRDGQPMDIDNRLL
ncbi:alanine racemase [Paenibacillus selenitireducens]|uniref:Alanine racemase n=1 Tax=Paenibacillus selenitireducens TaxID=1324314 RepID=A0A1T2X2G1_9BACL|nr:alanine racemase [Paenibacillus selenitireducens]OPA74039.1 alanine racemase [Paenibacillus selenitireducens]